MRTMKIIFFLEWKVNSFGSRMGKGKGRGRGRERESGTNYFH